MPEFTVVIPTYNEQDNVGELVRQLRAQMHGADAEVIFVDDSSDDTAAVVASAALGPGVPVKVIERSAAVGQLAGAVLVGILMARSPWVIVMDGDLQHPPEGVHLLMQQATSSAADVVIASRYMPGGGTPGLTGSLRRAISMASTVCAKGLFPMRLRRCSDPMTGFFAVRKSALRIDRRTPSGFKILLQLLLTNNLAISEVPLMLGPRAHGESKAGLTHGLRLARQLVSSRLLPRLPSPLAVSKGTIQAHPEGYLLGRLAALGAPPVPEAEPEKVQPRPYEQDVASDSSSLDAANIAVAEHADRSSGSCASLKAAEKLHPGRTHHATRSRRVDP